MATKPSPPSKSGPSAWFKAARDRYAAGLEPQTAQAHAAVQAEWSDLTEGERSYAQTYIGFHALHGLEGIIRETRRVRGVLAQMARGLLDPKAGVVVRLGQIHHELRKLNSTMSALSERLDEAAEAVEERAEAFAGGGYDDEGEDEEADWPDPDDDAAAAGDDEDADEEVPDDDPDDWPDPDEDDDEAPAEDAPDEAPAPAVAAAPAEGFDHPVPKE